MTRYLNDGGFGAVTVPGPGVVAPAAASGIPQQLEIAAGIAGLAVLIFGKGKARMVGGAVAAVVAYHQVKSGSVGFFTG